MSSHTLTFHLGLLDEVNFQGLFEWVRGEGKKTTFQLHRQVYDEEQNEFIQKIETINECNLEMFTAIKSLKDIFIGPNFKDFFNEADSLFNKKFAPASASVSSALGSSALGSKLVKAVGVGGGKKTAKNMRGGVSNIKRILGLMYSCLHPTQIDVICYDDVQDFTGDQASPRPRVNRIAPAPAPASLQSTLSNPTSHLNFPTIHLNQNGLPGVPIDIPSELNARAQATRAQAAQQSDINYVNVEVLAFTNVKNTIYERAVIVLNPTSTVAIGIPNSAGQSYEKTLIVQTAPNTSIRDNINYQIVKLEYLLSLRRGLSKLLLQVPIMHNKIPQYICIIGNNTTNYQIISLRPILSRIIGFSTTIFANKFDKDEYYSYKPVSSITKNVNVNLNINFENNILKINNRIMKEHNYNNFIENQSGSGKEYIVILGRKRLVRKIGRSKSIIYQGKTITISEAKKIEKQNLKSI